MKCDILFLSQAKRRKAKQKARAVHKRKGSGPSSAMDNIILPALIQEMNQVHSEELKLTINEVIQQFTLLDKESQQSTQNILNGMLSCLERSLGPSPHPSSHLSSSFPPPPLPPSSIPSSRKFHFPKI
eukprot:TRINITY_DN13329_c0_g1_i2.p1 TRINITY_DN13329_c0_g1~~TRINITY_DN13329_c0_g1_i2.p1  ORF type:complete len:128 (+),score=23.85 TRINITY_DN13329_c0_g1_i2:383-766(+)